MAAVEGVLSALERNWEMVDATLAGWAGTAASAFILSPGGHKRQNKSSE
jgi:hypothetical protein